MKPNIGSADKTIRLIIALTIAVLYFTETISGGLAMILGPIAIVFALTAFISFCPLYLPFGISTRKKEG